MRAKLDENLPVEAAELLRTAGWECDTVYDEGLAGADDPIVAARCQVEARVLFTLDLDFADIRGIPAQRVRRHRRVAPRRTKPATNAGVGRRVLPVLSAEWSEYRLWIVEPGRVRVRGANEPPV